MNADQLPKYAKISNSSGTGMEDKGQNASEMDAMHRLAGSNSSTTLVTCEGTQATATATATQNPEMDVGVDICFFEFGSDFLC